VCNFLNALIQFKVSVSGGGSDKYESLLETVPERRGQGQFELRKTTDIDDLCGDNPDVAIITLEHLKAEARERFNSSLVFTVAEIKGLEFHSIILWKLLSDESSKAMARVFVPPSATTSIHRPKAGHARPEFLPLCDAWITASSRAIERLIWVDDKTHAIENIYQYFASYTATASVTAAMHSEWTDVFARLRDIGAESQAEEVQRKHLPPAHASAPDNEAALASFKTYLQTKKRTSLPTLVKELLQADGRHEPSQTFIYFLVSHPEGCELLQSFYQKHQKIFNETIPWQIWFQATAVDQNMLQYLYPRAKSWCIQLMTNMLQKIPQEIFASDNPHSMLPLLSSDPEGQAFLLSLYRRYPKLIPLSFTAIAPLLPQILEQVCAPEQKEMRKRLNSLELKLPLKESKKYAKIAEQALKRSDIWLLGRLLQWGIAAQPIFKFKQNLLHLAAADANLRALQALCIPESKVDAQDEQGNTPLLLAVKKNALDVVHYLVGLGANLEQSIDNGKTALYIAVENGNLAMVQYLHQQGANIHHILEKGITLLMQAVANGQLAIVNYICLYDSNIDAIDIDGTTALAVAVEFGHLELVDYLYKKGANPSIRTIVEGGTPFLLAARHKHLSIVDFFYKIGGDINQTVNDGATALMFAAQNNHLQMVDYLCANGCCINQKMDNGKTALILAAQSGHVSIVQRLHQNGAHLDETAKDGASALFLAAQQNHLETVEYLCRHGAYTEHQIKDGVTALVMATQHGFLNIVECLCKHGANVHHRTNNNITLLYLAVQNGDLRMVEFLCKHVDLRIIKEDTADRMSPLFLAAYRGHLPIIEHFCKIHESWNMTLEDIKNIIVCAKNIGQIAIVKYVSTFLSNPSISLGHAGIFRSSEKSPKSATSSPPSP